MLKNYKDAPKALHINSYFLSNAIHYNFYKKIKKIKNDKFLLPVYKHFKDKDIEGVDIDFVLNSYDSKLFFTKAIKILFLVFKKKLLKDYEYIHAHTLFSDGFAAYILSILLRKKLVVSIRDTDVRVFLPASRLFVWLGEMILKRSKQIFFISPSLKTSIIKAYPKISQNKYALLPNGIDDFWIENINEAKKDNLNEKPILNILFVGQIIPRKNLEILLGFIGKYHDRKYILNIVGKNVASFDFESINENLTNDNQIIYLGEVSSKEELKRVYRKNDIFVLLSHAETFGVVYIEAISQGLPIIYTENQGVDGFFESGSVGYSCSTSSLDELKEKIDLILQNSGTLARNTKEIVGDFCWDTIIKEYVTKIKDI